MFQIVTSCRAAGAWALAILVGCSSPGTTTSPVATGPSDAAGAADVPTTASITLDGDANGLFWDASTSTLYIADDGNNRIVTYRDGVGTARYAALPPAPANGPGLGQLVRLDDGSVVVTRFGFGETGDVVRVGPDLSSAPIPGLDPTKRRIGLTAAPDGTLFEAYFVKKSAGQVGAIATLTLDGIERDVVTGLAKAVGVLATADALYVSDQAQGKLFKAALTDPSSLAGFAELPNADLLCTGPNGSLFSGGSDGNVRQIDSAGNVTVFVTGFKAVRGVAYDPAHRRLFIANHEGEPGKNTIEIRPVP